MLDSSLPDLKFHFQSAPPPGGRVSAFKSNRDPFIILQSRIYKRIVKLNKNVKNIIIAISSSQSVTQWRRKHKSWPPHLHEPNISKPSRCWIKDPISFLISCDENVLLDLMKRPFLVHYPIPV
jgi:hypothetical protein